MRSPIAFSAISPYHGVLQAGAFTSPLSPPLPWQSMSSYSFPFFAARITTNNNNIGRNTNLYSTINAETILSNGAISPSMRIIEDFLAQYEESLEDGDQWANEFGFAERQQASPEGSFYAVFRAIRRMDDENNIDSKNKSSSKKLLGLSGTPFYVPASLLAKAEGASTNKFSKYFTFSHLAMALEEDFLDAQVGSTDNRRGWQVSAVSQPTGSSFDDARMTLAQVETALESGTVIFNNIGAHIPHLAGATLASTDALSLPGALNMYVTAKGMRTSAPPHTDRQDVLVVQMEGAKRWRIFSPPLDGAVRPDADPFARGKGEDSLPLHVLLEGREGRLGTSMLVDVVTKQGDILYIPAGFPHTTDTVEETEDADYDTSIHLTFNIDTHVWDLDNLSVRNAALRRSGIKDVLAPQSLSPSYEVTHTQRYIGKVNQLHANLRSQLMDALPLKFLDLPLNDNPAFVDSIVDRLVKLCSTVDGASAISSEFLREALAQIHSHGSSILEIHRNMYLGAIDEGRLRKAEMAMTAHMNPPKTIKMTPEKIQRLSLFRVRQFFEQIDFVKKELEQWCLSGNANTIISADASGETSASQDPNLQFTAPLKVGDEVEAELGGAFFAAKICQIVGNTYNVVYFDGDRGDGLSRDQVKLLNPPSSEEIDTTGLTKKEIKKLKKKMKKNQRK